MGTKKEGREKINVIKVIKVHTITDGPAKGWAHTHGLDEYGLPELEIRNVPTLFFASACRILNDVADYMLNHATKPILAGQSMELDRATLIRFHMTGADDEGGYDSNHYEGPVLRIDSIEMPCTCCKPKAVA